ncbi:unnamed protein product [Ectocarpus sp. 12 AP-2014]
MDRSQLDFRKQHVPERERNFDHAGGLALTVAGPLSFAKEAEPVAPRLVTHGSRGYGGGRPTSMGRPTGQPRLQDASARPFPEEEQEGSSYVAGSSSSSGSHGGGFGEINSPSNNVPSEGVAIAAWKSLSQHRRCNSAPNMLTAGESCVSSSAAGSRAVSNWRNKSGLSSGVPAPALRDHAIPEGRRFEALEPPLQPSIAPDRPRSWRVRSTAPPWGTGLTSAIDFGTRDPSGSNAMDWVPKLRASYFVNVRGQGEAPATGSSVAGLVSQCSAMGVMPDGDTRPFEEIKRMRLSQALDSSSSSGGPAQQQQQQQDGMAMMGLTPSPTYSTSGRAPYFDTARLTPRFSPGKGVNVTGFHCRPPAFAGTGGGPPALGPLSPAMTEPPTPPSQWHVGEPEAFATAKPGDWGGVNNNVQASRTLAAAESEQGVLPMEQRPMDEVSAVQALMSVGLGTSVDLGTRAQLEAPTTTTAAVTSGPAQAGVAAAGKNIASTPPALVDAPKPVHCPVPSLARLKPFEGGDDDDDGLDKDLWVVVEKGSVCTSRDCTYRDAARIASRRHYHSNCTHTHNGGEKKGMAFHHHQLEKVQKHQRSHKREATKSAPYKRTTPEDHQAMEGAGVEGYRPTDWNQEETRKLDELVNQLVAPVTHAWPSIARYFPTKTGIQCLLHWRFTLNDNGIIRGNGTWGAEEDERLRKLAPVFSSPSTGPRWAKIAEVMPGRTAKQCRERYNNHVDPGIKKDKIWTAEEDALVMQLHAEHHNQFAKIARNIPGRCYDDVKNRRVSPVQLRVRRRQVAVKAAESGLSNAGNMSLRPTVERPGGASERRSPPPFDGTATAGLFQKSGFAEQSLGVKRSTPEMPGR